MPPQRLRSLIIGIAMAILGPAVGYVLYVLLLFHTAQSFAQAAPSLPQALANLQQFPASFVLALLPMVVGSLCGAVGLVIIAATLAMHFLGQPPAPSSGSTNRPQPVPLDPTPVTVHPAAYAPPQDDSRYMPKA